MNRSPELEALVAEWFAAASRGDASLVERHVPADAEVMLVGSDPEEWFRGGDAVAAFLKGEVEGSGGNATFTPSDTIAFEDGDVGWAATRVTITLPDGKHISPRWTSVFRRRDGIWTFVQTHASIAIPNDEVGWQYD
jgi:ketosteroid isomerase-like protein